MLLVSLSLLLFSSVAWAQQTTSIPMCPCVQTGSTCQKFDRRYQAYTVNEAMVAFPDLSFDHDGASGTPPTTVDEDEACTTAECNDCRKIMNNKLSQVGLVPASQVNPLTTPAPVANTTCAKYRFSNPAYSSSTTTAPGDSDSDSHEDDDDDDEEEKKKKKYKEEKRKEERRRREHNRDRRQAPVAAANDTLIGSRYTISCTARGVATDSSGSVSLCASCWVWRQLPSNFSPQYINELICDTTSTACLSGYATCSAGTRNVEVVRDDGNGIKTTVALAAGAYCECKAMANSAIQSLVSGSGLSTAVPANPAAPAGAG